MSKSTTFTMSMSNNCGISTARKRKLIKALPKMAKASSNSELAQGFEEHLEQTKGHAARIEEIFKALGEKPSGKKCKAMEGLIKEGAETIEEDASTSRQGRAPYCGAQRVEHYEIAGYGSVKTYAHLLGKEKPPGSSNRPCRKRSRRTKS